MDDQSKCQYFMACFYGFSIHENSLREFYELALTWFRLLKLKPSKMATALNRKITSFDKATRDAESVGYALKDLSFVEIYSEPFVKNDAGLGCEFSVSFSGRKRAYCAITQVMPEKTDLPGSLLGIISEVVCRIKPAYGVGLYGPQPKLGYFALGVGYGKKTNKEEGNRVISWGQVIWSELYRDGYLGGVFPWNLLSTGQLNRRVGGQTLKDWIENDKKRGTLNPVSEHLALWMLADDYLEEVYKQLWDAEIIFDYQRHIDRGGAGIIRRPLKY